ncbi:hypothetical protein BDD12DRAFT_897972 [Trichophaea hybrida]|nr:hypothetical protein BDD12DRAFT_897972 [Trichophaea hybrida]
MTITPPRFSPPCQDYQTPLPSYPLLRDRAGGDTTFIFSLSRQPPFRRPPALLTKSTESPSFSAPRASLMRTTFPNSLKIPPNSSNLSARRVAVTPSSQSALRLLRIHSMVRPVNISVKNFIVHSNFHLNWSQPLSTCASNSPISVGKYDINPNRTLPLDIQQLHQYICDSKTAHDTCRALDYARPRKSFLDVPDVGHDNDSDDDDYNVDDYDDGDVMDEDEDVKGSRKRIKLDKLEAW